MFRWKTLVKRLNKTKKSGKTFPLGDKIHITIRQIDEEFGVCGLCNVTYPILWVTGLVNKKGVWENHVYSGIIFENCACMAGNTQGYFFIKAHVENTKSCVLHRYFPW